MAWGLLVFMATSTVASASTQEWSDIEYIEGRYSRIYFDYVIEDDVGTFYCMNDWMVNRDDGGVMGGLLANEYNQFTFEIGGDYYEVRIFPNGQGTILKNGVSDPGALPGFQSSTGWRSTANDPVEHTIWEWSFQIQPTRKALKQFVSKDPPGGGLPVIPQPAPLPLPMFGGPSEHPHLVDAAFADQPAVPAPATVPTRPYQDPVRDPWFDEFDEGWDVYLLSQGGFWVIPEPASLSSLALGALLLRRRRMPAIASALWCVRTRTLR